MAQELWGYRNGVVKLEMSVGFAGLLMSTMSTD